MASHDKRLGLIAGNGRFPFLVLDAARAQGLEVIVAAIKEETFPEIESRGATVHWLSLGELSKLIETFKREGVHRPGAQTLTNHGDHAGPIVGRGRGPEAVHHLFREIGVTPRPKLGLGCLDPILFAPAPRHLVRRRECLARQQFSKMGERPG